MRPLIGGAVFRSGGILLLTARAGHLSLFRARPLIATQSYRARWPAALESSDRRTRFGCSGRIARRSRSWLAAGRIGARFRRTPTPRLGARGPAATRD